MCPLRLKFYSVPQFLSQLLLACPVTIYIVWAYADVAAQIIQLVKNMKLVLKARSYHTFETIMMARQYRTRYSLPVQSMTIWCMVTTV